MVSAIAVGADPAQPAADVPAAVNNAAEKASNAAGNAADNAQQKTEAAADKAGQSVDKATQSADKATQSADKAAGQASQAADRAAGAANNAANQAGNAAGQAADRAGNAANRAANQAGEAADRATNAAKNGANQAGNAADRAAGQAGQAVDRAAGAANNAADRAGNAANRAAGQAGQAADRATGTLNNAANQAGQAADRAAGQAGQAADRAAGAVNNATNQARDAAGRVINRTDINAQTDINSRTNVNAGTNVNVQGSAGVRSQTFDRVFTGLGLGWAAGANALTIANLAPQSPFASVGLTAGDQLVSIGGQRIATQTDFVRYLYGVPVGQRIPLVVTRNGVQQTLYWTPDPQFISTLPPQQEIFVAAAPQGGPVQAGAALGIRLDERVQDAAVVADVAAGSSAERAGVRSGDAIVALNEQRIDTPNDFVAVAGQLQPGAPVRMSISRMMDVELAAGQTTVVNRPIAQPVPAVVQPVTPVQPRAAGRRFFRNR